MSMETEAVLDRRRLRRRLSLWRVIAVIAGAIAVGALAYVGAGAPGLGERDQLARVTIEGVISEDRAQLQLLKKISEASQYSLRPMRPFKLKNTCSQSIWRSVLVGAAT